MAKRSSPRGGEPSGYWGVSAPVSKASPRAKATRVDEPPPAEAPAPVESVDKEPAPVVDDLVTQPVPEPPPAEPAVVDAPVEEIPEAKPLVRRPAGPTAIEPVYASVAGLAIAASFTPPKPPEAPAAPEPEVPAEPEPAESPAEPIATPPEPVEPQAEAVVPPEVPAEPEPIAPPPEPPASEFVPAGLVVPAATSEHVFQPPPQPVGPPPERSEPVALTPPPQPVRAEPERSEPVALTPPPQPVRAEPERSAPERSEPERSEPVALTPPPQPIPARSAVARAADSTAPETPAPARAQATHAEGAPGTAPTEAPVRDVAPQSAPARGEQPADALLPAGAITQEAEEPAKKKHKFGVLDIVLLAVAIALMISGVVVGALSFRAQHPNTATDMAGNYVMPDDPSVNDPAFEQAADAKPDTGARFKVPSVKLDVPLGELNVVDGVINPPGFTSAYRVRNLGVALDKASTGTVYVAAHSVRSPGMAPGNYVIDVPSGSVAVMVGSEIDVGDAVYKMTSSRIINKTDLGAQADLWKGTPGMLVFITCLQFPTDVGYQADGHSSENVIIIGQLVT